MRRRCLAHAQEVGDAVRLTGCLRSCGTRGQTSAVNSCATQEPLRTMLIRSPYVVTGEVADQMNKRTTCLVAFAVWMALTRSTWAQNAPPAPPPPATPGPETKVTYDEKCISEEIRACLSRVIGSSKRVAPRTQSPYCDSSEYEYLPRNATDPEPCLPLALGKPNPQLTQCREFTKLFPPERCERIEYTVTGWRTMLRAEFAAISEELKRACLAAGKTIDECARSPLALPAPPAAPASGAGR